MRRVGRGADFFDVEGFGADVALYGGRRSLWESWNIENFNAASGKVYIHGVGIHPGGAKNKMKSALLIGMEFQSLLPAFENPMYTDGYEGFSIWISLPETWVCQDGLSDP